MTWAWMDWFLLCCFHGLPFDGKLGRVRPASQAYYESEKLFFCGDLVVKELQSDYIRLPDNSITIKIDAWSIFPSTCGVWPC